MHQPSRHFSPIVVLVQAALLLAMTPSAASAASVPADSLADRLLRLGLENVGVVPASPPRLGYENRRYRHPAEALGRIAREARGPFEAVELREGMPAVTVTPYEEPGPSRLRVDYPASESDGMISSATLAGIDSAVAVRFRVRYPIDPDFGAAPPISSAPTSKRVDFLIGPVFAYELGRVFNPFLFRIGLETRVRWNPWSGAVAQGSVVFPIRNDFQFDPVHPDADQIRPGRLTLEQYRWMGGLALGSLSGGYFGDNRYGASLGLARPLEEGRLLLDAQLDATGFLAFDHGTEYSTPRRWSGFLGASWRPGLDFAVRARQAWFLAGDHGLELELSRALGDFDVAAFGQRTNGDNVVGLRLGLPVPPFTRPTGSRARVLPVERFQLDYHSRSDPVGRYVTGVASREALLRRLDAPSLEAGADRFRRGRGDSLDPPPATPPALVSLTGTTGFINTPWAGVMADGGLEVGANHVPRRWAYDERGVHANDVYYATLGFLPRAEGALRWTVIPGLRTFENIVPESRLTDTDYMASGRLELIPPAFGQPGLAVGVDDVKGTRRFHSTYAVTGMPFRIPQVQGRITLGYAFRALKATRHTLDGAFGAVEVSPWRLLAAQIEYDSEKWNVAVAVPAPFGIRLRAAMLHLQSLSLGAGIYIPFR